MAYAKEGWKADPNGLRRWINALGIEKGDAVVLPQIHIEWSAGEVGNLFSQNPEDVDAIYRGVGNKDGSILYESAEHPGEIQREGMSTFYGWRQFETIRPRNKRRQ